MHASQLPIEEPCHADWEAMSGDERRRFCGQCRLHVHDLSALTQRRAEQVLEEPDVCVRYMVDAQGDIAFQPETRARRRPLHAARLLAVAAAFASTPAFASGQARTDSGLLSRVADWLSEKLGLEDDEPAEHATIAPSAHDGENADTIPELEVTSVRIPQDESVVHEDEIPPRPVLMGRPAIRQPPAIQTPPGGKPAGSL